MFRLANYSDNEIDSLYIYLSSTASRVIWNALNQWAGHSEDILDLYMLLFAGPPVGEMDEDFFDGISQYVSPDIVRPEIKCAADKVKMGRIEVSADGLTGMELIARKVARMKDKMADPVKYYTFDLFEEYLFAAMLELYRPDAYEGETDPYRISTDEEIAASAEKLFSEFHVGEELEAEIDEPGIGRKYADFLAHTIHCPDKMSLWSSEEAGFESLFFWDEDYELVFRNGFVEGIRGLVTGDARILGYGYKDVIGIFSDAGIKAPLLLVGSETAFDTVGEVVQENMRIASPFDDKMFEGLEGFGDIPDDIGDLPFN